MCGAGAQNTVSEPEVDTATVSAVPLRPEFSFGREGVAYPQGRQHGWFHVLTTFTSIPCVSKATGMVFSLNTESKS